MGFGARSFGRLRKLTNFRRGFPAHEMYHRGQLTVYERLLGIEPALTQFFRKMTGTS